MWLERILQEKEKLQISTKTMSERTSGHLPEKTITRILSRKTTTPRIDTVIELGASVGLSPQELFADTNVVVATETLAEVKEAAEVIEAEKDLALVELEMLRAKTAAQEAEILLLKERLQHKEELLAVHNYYIKLKTTEQ